MQMLSIVYVHHFLQYTYNIRVLFIQGVCYPALKAQKRKNQRQVYPENGCFFREYYFGREFCIVSRRTHTHAHTHTLSGREAVTETATRIAPQRNIFTLKCVCVCVCVQVILSAMPKQNTTDTRTNWMVQMCRICTKR